MPNFFGAHVSAAGGLHNALSAANKLQVNTIQVHPSGPQAWNTSPFAEGAESKFVEERKSSGLKKIFFHAIYLINLATPDPRKFQLAKTSLVNYLDYSSRINGDGVIVHVGSMKDQVDEAAGYDRVVEGINWILDNAKNSSRLILEVAAGAGQIIGDKLEELQLIRDQVDQKERVGFGLDTQHMWASGYDWVGNFNAVIDEIDKVFSFDHVWSIHLNDSKTELASRKDRHENIGAGLIGERALKEVFLHPSFKDIPFILETPALETHEGAASELAKLQQFISNG